MLSVVLAGHPKLKNDLRRSSIEEIGSRATIFELEGLGSAKRKYLKWLLATLSGLRRSRHDFFGEPKTMRPEQGARLSTILSLQCFNNRNVFFRDLRKVTIVPSKE